MDWTDGNPSKVVEPGAAKKLLGWVALERPPFEFMNFLFFNTDEWVKYFEIVTDETAFARVDAIVDKDGNGSFLTLQEAHDSAQVTAGSTILITSDLELIATQNITKQDLEIKMQPGNRFLKGAGAPATNFKGISINATADRCRLMHLGLGRAGKLFNGSGDVVLQIEAGANDVLLFNPMSPPGNTADLTDNGTNTVVSIPQNVSV